MAKKKKKIRETTIEDYYDLRVDKVDELVAALKDENYDFGDTLSMDITDCTGVDDPKNYTRTGKRKQFDPYRTDFLGRVPTWIKAVFVKWWFFGVVCYFVNSGIALYVTNTLDLVVISGVVTGIVVEMFVNPIFRYMETDRKEFNDYMMFPFPLKAFWTFFTNIIYYVLVITLVNLLYFAINSYMFQLGVEGLLFGVFAVIVDMVFIGIKDGIVRLVKRQKNKENALNV